MTDTESQPTLQVDPAEASFRVLTQYLRDFSFENPGAPETLTTVDRPTIDMGVELNAKPAGEAVYEVSLRLSARAVRGEVNVFHVDIQYCGLFQISGVDPATLEQVLMIECPRYLFPYARRIISDATADGGFPPFMVEPIDFHSLYASRQQSAADPAAGQA